MDKITENLLEEFCNEHELQDLPQETQFEHFSAHIVVHRHFNKTFETGDIVTGCGNDIGIDALAILVNGTLVCDMDTLNAIFELEGDLSVSFVFVQSERSSHFDGAKILVIADGVQDFFSDTPRLARNDGIDEYAKIASALYKKSSRFTHKPRCKIYYVTTGKWTDDTTLCGRITTAKGLLDALGIFGEIEFTPVDANHIIRLYQQTRNAITRDFLFKDKVPLPDMPGVDEAHIGFLPASAFLNLICNEDGDVINSLFYDNVRDYLGDVTVNEEINKTLTSDAMSRFVLMNNGVTIIARKIINTSHKYTISDYSVVNGCQTSHVIAQVGGNIDPSVMVPIRLIGTNNEEVINDIIKATNRQTAITSDQFFALEEFPKLLERFFVSFPAAQRLYYERRDEQYARTAVEKTRIVTRMNAIKAYAAMFLDGGEPHRTTKDSKGLKSQLGKSMFAEGDRLEPYYTAAWALYRIEFFFRKSKIEAALKPARFHILYLIRLLTNNAALPRKGNANEFKKICAPIQEILWNTEKCEDVIMRAARIVRSASTGLDRNSIRTQEFTEKVNATLNDRIMAARDWNPS